MKPLFLLVIALSSCQPSFAYLQNEDGLIRSNLSVLSNSISPDGINKNNELATFDSFNSLALVAVKGNNVIQEPRKLLTTVQHRTTADVFLCPSFTVLPVMGNARHAVLWRGGSGNKPVMGKYRLPCCYGFLASLPPYFLRADSKTPLERYNKMHQPAQKPTCSRNVHVTALILSSLSLSRKIGTVELQRILAGNGLDVSLRTVQRRLNDLAAILPVESDNASPQGWRLSAQPSTRTATAPAFIGGVA